MSRSNQRAPGFTPAGVDTRGFVRGRSGRFRAVCVIVVGFVVILLANSRALGETPSTIEPKAGTTVGDAARPAAPTAMSVESEIIQRKPPKSAAANRTASSSPSSGGWVRMLQPIAIVFGIMAVLTWAGRRWLPQARQASGAQSVIRILARQHLSGKQSLCLVKLGPSVVLLGITPDHISNVLEIRDPDAAASLVAAVASSKGKSFTKAMAAFSASSEPEEPVEPEPRQQDGATASSERIREMVKRVRAMSEATSPRSAKSGVRQIS